MPAPHGPLLTSLAAFEQALPSAAATEAVARVRYQCGRLEQAIRYSHAEAIRFAAYTIGHAIAADPAAFDATVSARFADLKQALAADGHQV